MNIYIYNIACLKNCSDKKLCIGTSPSRRSYLVRRSLNVSFFSVDAGIKFNLESGVDFRVVSLKGDLSHLFSHDAAFHDDVDFHHNKSQRQERNKQNETNESQ